MMPRKLPSDAFSYYHSLGPDRSYEAVAEKYGVSKRTVTRLAKQETWQARVEEIERKAREAADRKAAETIEQTNQRHLRSVKVIQAKALEALRSKSLQHPMDAVRALQLAIKLERLILLEIGERPGAQTIEITMPDWRRHYQERLDRGELPSAKAQDRKKTDNESTDGDAKSN